MNPRAAQGAFEAYLRQQGEELGALVPARGIALMIGFYVAERAEGCAFDEDADGLLFQWGTHDWGDGEHLSVDITRQLILPDDDDDDAIWQLHLTWRFAPTPELRRLGAGNRWCFSPAELEGFREFVRTSPPLHSALPKAGEVTLRFECAG